MAINQDTITKTETITVTTEEAGIFISGPHAEFLFRLLGNHVLGIGSQRDLSDEIWEELRILYMGDPKVNSSYFNTRSESGSIFLEEDN